MRVFLFLLSRLNKGNSPKKGRRVLLGGNLGVEVYDEDCSMYAAKGSSRASRSQLVLGGSWDLVNKVISTLSGVISNYKYSYLNYNSSY